MVMWLLMMKSCRMKDGCWHKERSLKDEFCQPLQCERQIPWILQSPAVWTTGWQLQFERLDDNCSLKDWMSTAVWMTGWQLQFAGLDEKLPLQLPWILPAPAVVCKQQPSRHEVKGPSHTLTLLGHNVAHTWLSPQLPAAVASNAKLASASPTPNPHHPHPLWWQSHEYTNLALKGLIPLALWPCTYWNKPCNLVLELAL